jgi:hypothetical protein
MVTVRSHSRNLSPDPSVGSFEHRGARLATPTLFALYFLAVGVFVPGCENSSAPTGEPGRSGAALVDSVGGLFLWPVDGDALYHESRHGSSGPVFFQRGVVTPVTVSFIDLDGRPVPPESLGVEASLELTPSPAGLLVATPRPSEPFGFDLEAVEAGTGHLAFRLRRGATILYQSPGAEVEVVHRSASEWAPLDSAHVPDGPVRDLVVLDGRLVVAGGFTHLGSTEARGVASWDGTAWSGYADGLDDVLRLHVDGGALYAITASGYHRWNGTGWEEIAPALEGAISGIVFGGEAIVTGPNLGVLAWRDGGWSQIADSSWDGEALAVLAGNLYAAGSARLPSGPIPFYASHVWRRGSGSWTSIFSYAQSDLESCVFTHLKGYGDNLVFSLACGAPGGAGGEVTALGDAGDTRRIAARVVTAGTRLGDRYVFAEYARVLIEEVAGFDTIGTAGNGERIWDLESFGNAVIAAGDFTQLNGQEIRFLARWTP